MESQGLPPSDFWMLIEEDWQREDGTSVEKEASDEKAFQEHLQKTRSPLSHLQSCHGSSFLEKEAQELHRLAAQRVKTRQAYLRLRLLKRRIAFSNPLMDFGELLFCKRVPTAYSHLVMQYYGWRARPGGGLFVLENLGFSLSCRDVLQRKLDEGNLLEPCLSYDGKTILLSFVALPSPCSVPLPRSSPVTGEDVPSAMWKGCSRTALTEEDLRRVALWIDLNAIFYGVYLPEDQERQRRGEPVAMPALQ